MIRYVIAGWPEVQDVASLRVQRGIEEATYTESLGIRSKVDELRVLRSVLEGLDSADSVAIVAYDGETPVGLVTCQSGPMLGFAEDVGSLSTLFILPAYRETTVGLGLWRRALAWAQHLGLRALHFRTERQEDGKVRKWAERKARPVAVIHEMEVPHVWRTGSQQESQEEVGHLHGSGGVDAPAGAAAEPARSCAAPGPDPERDGESAATAHGRRCLADL